MSDDAGSKLPDPPRPDFTIPRLIALEMRAIRFERPRHRNFESALPADSEGVEFLAKTDRPIPIRAQGAVLYVGETAVTEVTEVEENTYRFVAPEREKLVEDSPITLGWTSETPSAEDVEKTEYRYRL